MRRAPKVINRICRQCYRKCKQEQGVQLLACPYFERIHTQMEIKVPGLNMPFLNQNNAHYQRKIPKS
ncbi:MAG: hypothetical protein WCY84_06615 [Candidatus Cloacimonadaceae bacterium]